MEKDNTNTMVKKLTRIVFSIDLMLILAFILIGISSVFEKRNTTKTTRALSEMAQQLGIDFPVETNNILGVWQTLKPAEKNTN